MKIEQFRIKDFKSIKELVIDDLNAINVFYGLNDAGKSNIFQALQLWTILCKDIHLILKNKIDSIPNHACRVGSSDIIELEMIISLILPSNTAKLITDLINSKILEGEFKLSIKFSISETGTASTEVKTLYQNNLFIRSHQIIEFLEILNIHKTKNFNLIDANRRIYQEHWQQKDYEYFNLVTSDNLKQGLFYAYLSRDFQHKQRFEAVKTVLAQEPFQLGQLDVALDPQSNEIDVGFVQQNNRLPIEQFGSGTQQLLLMLGQLFLNNYPLVALEEPEMNLSPTHQANLISTLQKLMQEPSSGLKQLFISTHSPYLEFTENAYYVFRGEDGWTQVKKVVKEEAENYFALESRGEENGARLNSQNQITLRDNIVQDLNLERGDFVFVLKNEATGRWELHTEEEVLPKLKEAWQD